MRILFNALGFGQGDNLGGSVRVAQANACALAVRGHELTFICTNRKDKRTPLFPRTTERISPEGIRVVYMRTTTIPWWPGAFGPHFVHGAAAWLAREVVNHDVVHLYDYRSHLAFAAARAARRARVPYVVQPQGSLRPGDQSRLIKRVYDGWLGRSLVDGAARVIAATVAEVQQLRASGVAPGRAVVVPSGIDISRFDPLPDRGRFRARRGLPAAAPMILSVGRLEFNKGQDILLNAFCELSHPEAVLVLAGPDYGLASNLRRIARQAGRAASVVLTGPLTDDREVREALVDSDIFVQPSRNEAFGIAILEACAASRPLLLSDGCENASAFRDQAALVVACESGAMAKGLARLLDDPALRRRFGAAGRAIVQRDFTLPVIAQRLESVYADAGAVHRVRGHDGSA